MKDQVAYRIYIVIVCDIKIYSVSVKINEGYCNSYNNVSILHAEISG